MKYHFRWLRTTIIPIVLLYQFGLVTFISLLFKLEWIQITPHTPAYTQINIYGCACGKIDFLSNFYLRTVIFINKPIKSILLTYKMRYKTHDIINVVNNWNFETVVHTFKMAYYLFNADTEFHFNTTLSKITNLISLELISLCFQLKRNRNNANNTQR